MEWNDPAYGGQRDDSPFLLRHIVKRSFEGGELETVGGIAVFSASGPAVLA